VHTLHAAALQDGRRETGADVDFWRHGVDDTPDARSSRYGGRRGAAGVGQRAAGGHVRLLCVCVALHRWLTCLALAPHSTEADPRVLAKYVLALLHEGESRARLKQQCTEQLDAFLGGGVFAFCRCVLRAQALTRPPWRRHCVVCGHAVRAPGRERLSLRRRRSSAQRKARPRRRRSLAPARWRRQRQRRGGRRRRR
jgi:hypothetical protein